MKATPLWFFVLLFWLLPGGTFTHAAIEPDFSPKVSFRVGNGILQNAGTAGGNSLSLGAVGLVFNYFFTGKTAVGMGYSTSPPFTGISISGRHYFYGQGTRSRQQQDFISSEHRDTLAHYLGVDMARTSYVMTSKRPGASLLETVTGETTTLNLALGSDFRISRHFELTAEANMAVAATSSSNNTIKMKGYILNTGISYIW